jgi:hypothetical protein
MAGQNSNTGRGHGRGCGNKGRGGRGKSQGNSGHTKPTFARGACADLGNHVFDYGPKGPADQRATTWEQINIYVGTKFVEEITNTLRNGKEQPIPSQQFQIVSCKLTKPSWQPWRQGPEG